MFHHCINDIEVGNEKIAELVNSVDTKAYNVIDHLEAKD